MVEQENNYEFKYQGMLQGHSGQVTSIVAGISEKENEDNLILISGSRDKSLIIWKLFEEEQDGLYGQPFKQLTGHNHFVSDLAISNENQFVISSSWDKTLRLWDLKQGKTSRTFLGHKKEVFSVSFSPDNRQILSGGCEREIKLWNTLADCKWTSDSLNHTDWISCIRYSPLQKSSKAQTVAPYFVSVGWDGRLKIWNNHIQVKNTFKAHEGNINSVSISPNGRYIASGGKDKKLYIWDIQDLTSNSREFNAGSTINQIAINPKLQWVAAATDNGIKIWDLMSVTNNKCLANLTPEKAKDSKGKLPTCTSLTWNSLGKKLFAGFSDGNIRVWDIVTNAN